MKKKIIALALAAAMFALTILGSTFAYLTSETGAVKNTFTVGDVDITIDEAEVDVYGVKVGDNRVGANAGNTYKLIPGHSYVKDPTVTVVEGSEKCYVRMFVTISDITDVKAVFGAVDGKFLPQYFVEGWDNSEWVTTGVITEAGNVATYEFRYATTVDALAGDVVLPALFSEIVVPDGIANDDLAKVADMEINVYAQAIQADGFDTPEAAWLAWPTNN